MISITVTEETRTADDMAHVLRTIADKIEQGYTSGYGPNFSLNGEEETEFEEDKRYAAAVKENYNELCRKWATHFKSTYMVEGMVGFYNQEKWRHESTAGKVKSFFVAFLKEKGVSVKGEVNTHTHPLFWDAVNGIIDEQFTKLGFWPAQLYQQLYTAHYFRPKTAGTRR